MTLLTRAVWVRMMPTSTMAAPMIWTRFKLSPSHSQTTMKARITSDGDHGRAGQHVTGGADEMEGYQQWLLSSSPPCHLRKLCCGAKMNLAGWLHPHLALTCPEAIERLVIERDNFFRRQGI